MILNRKQLGEEIVARLAGAALIGAAFWFRPQIEARIGQTATSWVLDTFLFLYLLSVIPVVGGWIDILGWERSERKQKLQDARERAEVETEERQAQAEYDAFVSWAKQNPRTVDRLLANVEFEQIGDDEHRSWLIERREKEGPNALTDLPRLFDWLKARRELEKWGIQPPFSQP